MLTFKINKPNCGPKPESFVFFLLALLTFVPSGDGIVLGQETEQQRAFWTLQKTDNKASLRGLSVVSDQVAWASGTGGTVLKTDDGINWKNVSIKSEPELDFRDIEAFSKDRAIVVSAGSPGRIYLTNDAGKTWKKVYEDMRAEIFFDAMVFLDEGLGVVFGDPIDGHAQLVGTIDAGETWEAVEKDLLPKMNEGEAGFAASGTCMILFKEKIFIATGGLTEGKEYSRVLSLDPIDGEEWDSVDTPIKRNASSGIFSIAGLGDTIVAVGGDYQKPEQATNHIAISNDVGKTWSLVTESTPNGYRSGVAAAKSGDKITWITVGPNGTDLSNDPIKKWQVVDDGAFHAVAFSPSGKSAWATGPDGRIGKWTANE